MAIPGTEFFGHLVLASFLAPRLPIGCNIEHHLETLNFLMLADTFQSGQHFTQTVLKSSNKKKSLKVHKIIFLIFIVFSKGSKIDPFSGSIYVFCVFS